MAKKTNQSLVRLISDLKKNAHKNRAPIWKDVAKRLEKPQRSWAEVNIRKLALHTKKNEVVIVPGKLLGGGNMNFPVTVAAFSFTKTAKIKIQKAGGKSVSIPELVKMHPKGKDVRIIG
ncbi:MAG: 50S ribosomal protein L18e [Thermoplasmata archaeon]|nr:MAG: 50S ribosomal protein L18e [Thermoplasmata archaeon]